MSQDIDSTVTFDRVLPGYLVAIFLKMFGGLIYPVSMFQRLAGLGAGYLVSTDAIVSLWPEDRAFGPKMGDDRRQALIDGWHEAVNRALSATDP